MEILIIPLIESRTSVPPLPVLFSLVSDSDNLDLVDVDIDHPNSVKVT